MLGKTYAFAQCYSSVVATTMHKTIQEPERFRRIAEKIDHPAILDSPAARESFKEYLSKSFKNYPDVVAVFEE